MLSSLRHEFCLKILSFLSSQTSVEVGSPRKTSGFDRGAHDFLCRKKAVELRETSPVGSWRRGWNLLFIVCHPKKKRFAVVIMKNAKRWQGKKNLNMSFILGTFLHLFSLTKLLILWTFLCQKKKPFTADSAWNQSERVNKSPRPKHSS